MSFFEDHKHQIKTYILKTKTSSHSPEVNGLHANYLNHLLLNSEKYDSRAKFVIALRGDHFSALIKEENDPFDTHTLGSFLAMIAKESSLRTGFIGGPDEQKILLHYDVENSSLLDDERTDIQLVEGLTIIDVASQGLKETINQRNEIFEIAKLATQKIEDTVDSATKTAIQTAENLETIVRNQQESLDDKKSYIEDLERSYNFIGLYQGFENLKNIKSKQRVLISIALVVTGIVMIGIPTMFLTGLWEFLAVHTSNPNPTKFNAFQFVLANSSYKEIVIVSPVILSIEVIVIYFFRIILSNFQSVSAVIIQLELRKALCSFIESYTDHKKNLGDNVDLSGFENIVFSELSNNPGKVPHTIDGLEQMAKMVNKQS